MANNEFDPKGLIRESYRIEGITAEECRSIFLDWALSLRQGVETNDALEPLLAEYETAFPQHPMTDLMRQGLLSIKTPRRRGGWRSRSRS
ncbi:hypothetical protein [Shimia sp.]|uniref:hypothetical protein n=1 Tax=Shimia sp. TaxID=1954381 RepID=UPI003296EC19